MNASRLPPGLDTSAGPAFDPFPSEDTLLVASRLAAAAGHASRDTVFDAALDIFPSERDLRDRCAPPRQAPRVVARSRWVVDRATTSAVRLTRTATDRYRLAVRSVGAHAPAACDGVRQIASALTTTAHRYGTSSLRRLRAVAQVTVADYLGFRRVVCAVAIAAQVLVAAQLFLAPAVAVPAPQAASTVVPRPDPVTTDRGDALTVQAAGLAAAPRAAPDRRLPSAAPRVDGNAIQRVLNRYRDASSTLDVAGVLAVWPSADAAALRAAFDRLAEQNLDYHGCEIAGSVERATAVCRGVGQARRVGSKRTATTRQEWQFALRRDDGQWFIATVVTR